MTCETMMPLWNAATLEKSHPLVNKSDIASLNCGYQKENKKRRMPLVWSKMFGNSIIHIKWLQIKIPWQ